MVLERAGLTGASGMLGGYLLSEFGRRGISCCCTSRSRPGELPNGSEWSSWDLRDRKSHAALDALFPNVQAIVLAGATVPSAQDLQTNGTLFEANVRSSLVIGEWALDRGLPVVFMSGAIVYAFPDRTGITERDEAGPRGFGGFYGFSKYLGELLFQHLALEGLRLCILRPSSIYGYVLHPTKMISKFLNTSMNDEVIELLPPFGDAIDLVHASDVAIAAIQALENEAVGVYNIASGRMASVQTVAETCVEVTGAGSVRLIGESEAAPTRRFGLNCTAAQQAFSYSPRMSLRKGLADMSAVMKHGVRS